MRPPPSIYVVSAFICNLGRAVLTNHTVDDTDPSVIYDTPGEGGPYPCNPTICNAPGTPDENNYGQMIQGTMTVVPDGVLTTIRFTGNSVCVFFATRDDSTCTFQLDGQGVGWFKHSSTSPSFDRVLGYRNTSMPNGPHALAIAASNDLMDFDGLVDSADDDEASSVARPSGSATPPATSVQTSPSTRSLSASTSAVPLGSSNTTTSPILSANASTPANAAAAHQKQFPVAATAGGVVSGGIFFTGLLLLFSSDSSDAVQTRKPSLSQYPSPSWAMQIHPPSEDLPRLTAVPRLPRVSRGSMSSSIYSKPVVDGWRHQLRRCRRDESI